MRLTSVQEMLAFTDITHIEAADINTVTSPMKQSNKDNIRSETDR